MIIQNKELINAFLNLYDFIMAYEKGGSPKLGIPAYLLFDDITDDEQVFCEKVNNEISSIDIEYGMAELENRKVNNIIVKESSNNLKTILNEYKYNIRIDHKIKSRLLGYDINQSIEYVIEELKTHDIIFNGIVQEGLKSFSLNDITIIDFVRINCNAIFKKDGYLVNNGTISQNTDNILLEWQQHIDEKKKFKAFFSIKKIES